MRRSACPSLPSSKLADCKIQTLNLSFQVLSTHPEPTLLYASPTRPVLHVLPSLWPSARLPLML